MDRMDRRHGIGRTLAAMPPRFFVDLPLRAGAPLALPAGVARHVQVLRLQPGAALMLFDGEGGEWHATVLRMGRSSVDVALDQHVSVDRELALHVTLAVGMPANERMDTLVEKATELGVGAIQPLLCERAVLRLSGERAEKKVAHWQAVAIAACEQSGRTRVPQIAPVCSLVRWLQGLPEPAGSHARRVTGESEPAIADPARHGSASGLPERAEPARWLLGFDDDARAVVDMPPMGSAVVCLSGPEGGLSADEVAAARAVGFVAVSLGPRVLRADTAPLAVLAHLATRR